MSETIINGNIKLLKGKVLVKNLAFGTKKIGSIYLPDDDGKNHGIRPRWAEVFKVADDVEQVEVGDYVLLKHARWTRKMEAVLNGEKISMWMIDYPDAVLLKSKEMPDDIAHMDKSL